MISAPIFLPRPLQTQLKTQSEPRGLARNVLFSCMIIRRDQEALSGFQSEAFVFSEQRKGARTKRRRDTAQSCVSSED